MHNVYSHAFVYKITFPNSKIYIGRWTNTFDKLLNRYLKAKTQRLVERAINKYGFENCVFEIIEKYENITNQELNEKEIFWISEYQSTRIDIGYNLHKGGNVSVLDVASKNSISAKAKERLKDKHKHPSYGLKRTQITCKKISESLKGKYCQENNPNWKEYLEKDLLLRLITNGGTFRTIAKELNTSQKTIEKSLNFHFGTKSLKKVRDFHCMMDKQFLTKLLQENNTYRSLAKNGIPQSFIEKNLQFWFGTTSLSEAKYKLGMGKCFWQKFNQKNLDDLSEEISICNFEFLNKTEIKGYDTPLKLRCSNGHVFKMNIGGWKIGHRCHKCYIFDRTQKKILELKNSMFNEGYTLLRVDDNFTGKVSTEIEYKCPVGHIRKILWGNWVDGHRCGSCALINTQQKAREKHEKSADKALEILRQEMIKENYILLPGQNYKNAKTKLKYVCANGHQKELNWSSWFAGNRCMKCRYKNKKQGDNILAK
jgi:group I intron endonuclease